MMDIYTYCSYRGSYCGFQFASFNSKDRGEALSFPLPELKQHAAIPNEYLDWCQNKSDWHILLERLPDGRYLLVAKSLEESRYIEMKENKRKGSNEPQFLDSDYYITLGFCGTAKELLPYAYRLVIEFNDGFRKLFNKLEKTISKTADARRYLISVPSLLEVFSDTNVKEVFSNTKPAKNIFGIFQRYPQPYFLLSSEEAKNQKIPISERRKEVERCAAQLSDMESFSENILLLIAYNHFNINQKINIRIDHEYLW